MQDVARGSLYERLVFEMQFLTVPARRIELGAASGRIDAAAVVRGLIDLHHGLRRESPTRPKPRPHRRCVAIRRVDCMGRVARPGLWNGLLSRSAGRPTLLMV